MTTGELQQRVYLHGQRLPGRAVIVGAEHVSFSALVTLAHAGARVMALVTEHPAQQSYRAFAAAARLRWRVPVWTHTSVRQVLGARAATEAGTAVRGGPGRGAGPAGGGQRLDGVELTDIRTGATRFCPCDWLVFTGDWIPDHELARLGGVAIDPATRGPAVDTALETSAPLVFAAGNLIHPAETADVAALNGRHAARQIAAALAGARYLQPVAPHADRRGRPRGRGPGQRRRCAGRGGPDPGRGGAAAHLDLARSCPAAGAPAGRALPAALRLVPARGADRGLAGGPAAGPDPLRAPGPRPPGPPAGGLGRPARPGIGPGPRPAQLNQSLP